MAEHIIHQSLFRSLRIGYTPALGQLAHMCSTNYAPAAGRRLRKAFPGFGCPVHWTGKGCSVIEISLLERHVLLQAICQQSFFSSQVLQFTLGFIHLFNSAISLVMLFWHLSDQEPKPFDYIRIVPASC